MQKILSFIVNNDKLLGLYSNPHPQHGKGGRFVVTGGVEDGETLTQAVYREIKEETGLICNEMFDLNWGSIYNWHNETCEEYNFISFVNKTEISLNEEHSKFKWLDLNKFIEVIKWDDDKKLLKKVLKKGLNLQQYFNEMNIIDYR